MQPWNFGSRTIKGRVGGKAKLDKAASQVRIEPVAAIPLADATAVAAEAAAVAEPMILEPEWEPTAARRPPAKKGGPRKAVAGKHGKKGGAKSAGAKSGATQICRDCGQVSYTLPA